jgi:hypothetical protein
MSHQHHQLSKYVIHSNTNNNLQSQEFSQGVAAVNRSGLAIFPTPTTNQGSLSGRNDSSMIF